MNDLQKEQTFKLIRITTVPVSLSVLLSNQMKFMGDNGAEVIMISADGEEVPALIKKECCKHIVVPMTRKITLYQDIICVIKLIKIFIKIKPDIIHTHTPKAGLLGMLAAWITRVPVRLHTVAGMPLMEATGVKRSILNLVERITYFCASMVYPNSNNLKKFITENDFCSPGKLKVIGNGSSNGINTTYFKKSPQLNVEADILRTKYSLTDLDFVFIFVGRLVKDKGIEELVQAFSSLNSHHTNTKLLLVGMFESDLDPLSDDCFKVIETNKSIIMTGFQTDIRPYLTISNALVFPSYREGFPNVPMQAGCFDLPSIVTDINGCNEIIEHEKNGLIIPVKNIAALYDAMTELVTNKPLYLKLKSNARSMICDKYEQEKVWSLLLNEYQNHLNKHVLI